jgi:hypothetical protein
MIPVWALPDPDRRYMTFVHVESLKNSDDNQSGPNRPPERWKVSYRRMFAFFLLVFGSGLAMGRDLALVSNKSNNVSAVTYADLVKICKAQTNRLPDGKTLTLVMRSPSAPEMKLVLDKIYGMPGSDVNDLITTVNRGRSNHPAIMVVTSDDDLINTVASVPGAVGIVDIYSINSSVAVVKVAGKLPLEPGYLLHGN